MTDVIIEKRGRAGIISLDRPKAMNALDLPMIRDIDHAVRAFLDDAAIECIVLRSAHERAFCAGGDMRRIRELSLQGQFAEAERFFEEEYALIERIAACPKPFVSLIDGVCMGGGMGLSMHGAYRVATERALFAMPEVAIGFFPDVGGSHFLSRMPLGCGMWMGLTGASVRGFEAQGLGISTHMTTAEVLPSLLEGLCHSSDRIEDVLARGCAARGTRPEILLLSDIAGCFAQPTLCTIIESLQAHRGKRKDQALHAMRKASPRSLLETLTLIRQGKELSLRACLDQELAAMRRAIRHPDLIEGVRAVLVDKDHAPTWQANAQAEADARLKKFKEVTK